MPHVAPERALLRLAGTVIRRLFPLIRTLIHERWSGHRLRAGSAIRGNP